MIQRAIGSIDLISIQNISGVITDQLQTLMNDIKRVISIEDHSETNDQLRKARSGQEEFCQSPIKLAELDFLRKGSF